jgi:hypothetical protein
VKESIMSFNRFRHPEGTRLPALERNILKYRGFEMLLMLFYVEELREMIIGAVRASARWKYRDLPRIEPATKNKFKVAMTALARDGILSQHESDEIVKLVDIRNIVGHELHKMTFDISRDTWARQVREVEEARYDSEALGRVKSFLDTLEKRMRSKYVREISLDTLLFRSAERTYSSEIRSLKRKIDAQYQRRGKKLASLKGQLSLQGTEFEKEEFHPAHPANMGRNGCLTKRGVEICFRLFDLGKSPLAVAYLMYISVRAARKRYRHWLRAGRKNRKRFDF